MACHRHSDYLNLNAFTHEIYLDGKSVPLKPLNENQQYKKQLEISLDYVPFSLYGQVRNERCNHKFD